MKKIVRLLCFCITLSLISACNEDNDHELSDIALIIKPSAIDSINVQSDDKVIFDMQYYVNTGGQVNRLQVKSVNQEYGETILLDTAYAEIVKETTFLYTAPQSSKEELKDKLTFTIWETNGSKTQQTRIVTVANKLLMMQELGPIVMLMATGKADAIEFKEPTQTFDHELKSYEGKADMYLNIDTISTGNYALSFLTETQARFVRANSFDYASANTVAIQTIYANSVRTTKVDNLQTNDIIIVGHEAKAEGIIFIQNIVRIGTDNDLCLQMRFKPLQKPAETTASDKTEKAGK